MVNAVYIVIGVWLAAGVRSGSVERWQTIIGAGHSSRGRRVRRQRLPLSSPVHLRRSALSVLAGPAGSHRVKQSL